MARKKTPTLHVGFVMDMSGSMGPLRDAAIEGANEYLTDLKADKHAKKTRITIVCFDHIYEVWHRDVPVAEVPFFDDRYEPRGSTALNDAIAKTITDMFDAVGTEDKGLVVVLTDGYENASVEYGGAAGHQRLVQMIEELEGQGNWTIVYLGAGEPEAVQRVASSYSIPVGNTVAYSSDVQSTAMAFAAVSGITRSVSNSPKMSTITATQDAGVADDVRS